jgi:MoxR-like ATPase
MAEPMSIEEAAERSEAVMDRVASAAVIERPILETVFTAVLARGHVLLEDVPGTGKTVTARLLAEALGLDFARIQFTPDLLPSDITGSNVYDEHEGRFRFSEGPVFTNVVLADEINRAPPKTQAALLEAMEERQVSIDGETHQLPEPFFVIATQNPIEQEGTFRLPEAQRDRFSVKTSLGYPSVEGEMELLDRRANRRTHAPDVDPVTDTDTVRALRQVSEEVRVEDDVRRYIIYLARATRTDTRTEVGVSPRGIQRVFETARARAVIAGREYVTPDDVKAIAEPAMTHRLVLTTEAGVEGIDPRQIVRDAMASVDVPGVAPDAETQPAAGPGTQQPQGRQQPPGNARQPPTGQGRQGQPQQRPPQQSHNHHSQQGRQPRGAGEQRPQESQHQQPRDQQNQQPQNQNSQNHRGQGSQRPQNRQPSGRNPPNEGRDGDRDRSDGADASRQRPSEEQMDDPSEDGHAEADGDEQSER